MIEGNGEHTVVGHKKEMERDVQQELIFFTLHYPWA